MQVVYQRCCGLAIHKKLIVACLVLRSSQGVHKEIHTFSTTLADLYRLRDWLVASECQMVAMESTGVYWRPIWNMLEEEFALMLVNAQHMKAVQLAELQQVQQRIQAVVERQHAAIAELWKLRPSEQQGSDRSNG